MPYIHVDGWCSTLNQDGTSGRSEESDANVTQDITNRLRRRNGWGGAR
jgi:hypothetical protein